MNDDTKNNKHSDQDVNLVTLLREQKNRAFFRFDFWLLDVLKALFVLGLVLGLSMAVMAFLAEYEARAWPEWPLWLVLGGGIVLWRLRTFNTDGGTDSDIESSDEASNGGS